MSALDLPPVSVGALSVAADAEDGAMVLRFAGTADMRASNALDELLAKAHAEAMRLAAHTVTVDFRELEFMNSSCLKSFVSWIGNVRDLERERQYKIRFLSKPEILWQRRSLHALRCFAVDLITVVDR